jgi:hypothetical protein
MRGYDTQLFLEIIETTPGVIFLRQEIFEDIITRFYQGLSGKLVVIECTDEEIAIPTCKSYLIQLGLSDLILSIFPEKNFQEGEIRFKVGDHVFGIETGKKYQIVGDSKTPFCDKKRGNIFPIEDHDFVLIDLPTINDLLQIVYAKKEELVLA